MREKLIQLVDQCLDYIDNETTALAEAPMVLPPETYWDEQQFNREVNLFTKRAQYACMSVDLPQAGDIRVHDDTGIPIILTRDKDGKARAFINSCSHRCARLVAKSCSGSKAITCPFHGWSYGLNGELRGISYPKTFGDVDRKELGLMPLPIDEKYGMIFINPDPNGSCNIDNCLGELASDFKFWNLPAIQPVESREIISPANWKFAMDTFLDIYHIATLHPETLSPLVMTNYGTCEVFGENLRMAWPLTNIQESRDIPNDDIDPTQFLNLDYLLFPGKTMFFGPQYVNVTEVFAGESSRDHRARLTLYSRTPFAKEERHAHQETFEFLYTVLTTEDYKMCNEAQPIFNHRMNKPSVLGRNEINIIHLHKKLQEATSRL